MGLASGVVKVRQISLPVAASSATTLPRNVQQGYCGLEPEFSSCDAMGTYSLPACSLGVPVMRVKGCESRFFCQISLPVAASRA